MLILQDKIVHETQISPHTKKPPQCVLHGLFGKKAPENMPVPISADNSSQTPVPQAELPMDDGTGVREYWAEKEKPKSLNI